MLHEVIEKYGEDVCSDAEIIYYKNEHVLFATSMGLWEVIGPEWYPVEMNIETLRWRFDQRVNAFTWHNEELCRALDNLEQTWQEIDALYFQIINHPYKRYFSRKIISNKPPRNPSSLGFLSRLIEIVYSEPFMSICYKLVRLNERNKLVQGQISAELVKLEKLFRNF